VKNHDGRREEIYPKIPMILEELHAAKLKPPKPLLQLAGITGLKLFVSLTFDSLLCDALNEVRFQGRSETQEMAYFPDSEIEDLPPGKVSALPRPLVYQLLGRASTSPEYVINDEDTLEFLFSLQSGARPEKLVSALDNHHLLIIGCHFSDWLGRFFLRTTKRRQLSIQRAQREFLVGPAIETHNPRLVHFLKGFSYSTRIIDMQPAAFVAKLAEKWAERIAPKPPPIIGPGKPPPSEEDLEIPKGAIFISYSRADLESVKTLKRSLAEAANLDLWFDVWLDVDELKAGTFYEDKIQDNIRNCDLFIPVISRTTEARVKGFFHREWNWAADHSLGFAPNVEFVVPVVIDDTEFHKAQSVPRRFKSLHATTLPGGQATPEFCKTIVEALRARRKAERS